MLSDSMAATELIIEIQYAEKHGAQQPYVVMIIKETLEEFRWEVLPHPPYTLLHLFLSITHGLAE